MDLFAIENEKLELLRQSMEQSQKVTNESLQILDVLESKLSTLGREMEPFYTKIQPIRRAQSNLDLILLNCDKHQPVKQRSESSDGLVGSYLGRVKKSVDRFRSFFRKEKNK